MGSDDLFKKRREARKQRQHEFRMPKANSFLIVTEGERTEPLYFKGIQKLIKEKVGGMVDVVEAPVIDIHGEGCATGKLIEIIYNLVNSFDGVNTAINNAKRRMASFRNGVDKPSEYDPGTMVYKLVQELKVYLEEI